MADQTDFPNGNGMELDSTFADGSEGDKRLQRLLWVVFLGLFWLAGMPDRLYALEVRDIRWGFNGTIHRNTFNLLTIELDNPDSTPFDGLVELRSVGGIGRGDSCPMTELNLYIGPGESRIVQFTPIVSSSVLEWELNWAGTQGTGRSTFTHPQNQSVRPVVVQFRPDQGVSSPIKGLAVFRESDFPIGAAGTEELGTVVLDHIPRWDEVRNRAFRDWLGRGGQLYLIHDRGGQLLDFPAVLNELNVAADRFQVGQGTVIRHPMVQDVSEISGLVAEISATAVDPSTGGSMQSSPTAEGARQLFSTMRSMVRPNHNWSLIFFLALVYLVILFPGIWLVGQRRSDFRVTYALVLGTVLLFSWLYSAIGKRGYNESTGLKQMILAYPLGNDRIAMQKYSSLFVTDGGSHAIPTKGEGAIQALDWSTDFSGEGAILNRPVGGIGADIPPYSACSYLENSVLPSASDYSWKVNALDVSRTGISIDVSLGAGFPPDAKVFFVTQDKGVSLDRRGGHWTAMQAPLPVSSLFPVEYIYAWNHVNSDTLQKNLLAYMVQTATAVNLGYSYEYESYSDVPSPASNDDPLPQSGYLLVYGDAPQEFLPSEFSSSGQVMFVIRVDASMVTPEMTAAP